AKRQQRKPGDFWNWSPARAALEGHFASGALAIANRRSGDFARVYDVVERVIPEEHRGRELARDEAERELGLSAARSHGGAAAGDLADYYRIPLRTARRHVEALVSAGALQQVQVEGWPEPAFVCAGAEPPARLDACALLSPFDPVVWHRARAERL